MSPPPFVWIRDRLWTVANWTDRMPDDAWLLLRPATPSETDNYLDLVSAAEEEAFWTSVLTDALRAAGHERP